MPKNLVFWLTLALTALSLVASAILFVDYVRPSLVFCDVHGSCATVKQSAFAYPFGIPMPAIGLTGLLGVGLSALVPGRWARMLQFALAVAGALVAVVLFAVQGKLGVLCPYCAVVDTSALGLGVLSFLRLRGRWDPPRGWIAPGASVAGLVASIGIPLVVGFRRELPKPSPYELPDSIAAEMKRTGKGKVTVVDYVDFECPFCRMTHAELAPLLDQRKDKVRVARKHVPLRMHPHALDAARAACCAESLGKGDEMANALFVAPVEELTPEGCEKLAKQQGIDVERFRACVRDPATEARIDKDKEAFRAGKGHGLPTIWVDGTKLEGAQERSALKAALDSAISKL